MCKLVLRVSDTLHVDEPNSTGRASEMFCPIFVPSGIPSALIHRISFSMKLLKSLHIAEDSFALHMLWSLIKASQRLEWVYSLMSTLYIKRTIDPLLKRTGWLYLHYNDEYDTRELPKTSFVNQVWFPEIVLFSLTKRLDEWFEQYRRTWACALLTLSATSRSSCNQWCTPVCNEWPRISERASGQPTETTKVISIAPR